MKTARLKTIALTFWLIASSAKYACAAQPNFVLILGEAQGWASMSVPLDDRNVAASKSDFILTPNLDSIALAGVRFSDFYAASPRCTPTRAALVTGRSPAALHMTFVNEGKKDGGSLPGDKVISPPTSTELPADIETMAMMMKRAGYATAHFGKWHLGRANPREHGFDENDGANSNGGPENVESPNPKQAWSNAKQGVDFITREAQAKKPFFLQLSQYPGRGEETALPETVESVKRRLGTRMDFQRIGLAAGDEEIDKTIGLVLAKLKELGLMNNTYIIYTADHGAQGRNANGGLTNGKGTVWEGGLRVPMLIAGPGIKAGGFSHVRASTVDLLPTVAELAGLPATALPKGLEGGSLVKTVKQDANNVPPRAREELVIHFPHYDKDDLGPASATLLRDFKMIRFYEEGPRRRLYDVSKDFAEEHDLAAAKPDIVAALDKRMNEYFALVGAGLPTPNPNYDPNGERSGDHKGGGGKGGKGGKGGGKKGKGMKPDKPDPAPPVVPTTTSTTPSTIPPMAQPEPGRAGGKGGTGGGGGQGGGAGVEPAVVPEYLFNIILGRPGTDSITASVLAWKDMEAAIAYGENENALTQRTPVVKLTAGEPANILLDKLKPDTAYHYQLLFRVGGSGAAIPDTVRGFHTQRAPGSPFIFDVQADSHLDTSTDVRVYQQTLANLLADKPDFMIDLGDTTMVDKFGNFYTRSETQYKAQRYWLGRIAHSVPVFLTLGNHDGEKGERLTGQPNSMPLWSVGMRKKYFPNPEPGGIYTGDATPFESAGLLEDYYAWQWGGALFIVLDPFWFTRQHQRDDNWGWTLGETQYRWLTKTLETSKAPFKFVFIHHLVGGLVRDVRGGAAIAPYMEWGGKNADGSEGFAQHRPGWPLPIHQLFVKHGVSIVFHGHDHLYAKEELDGIIYQDVPQPGHPGGNTRTAEEYGYKGVILPSSGHLRVAVSPTEARVDYIGTSVPGVTRSEVQNGSVEHSYTIKPRAVR